MPLALSSQPQSTRLSSVSPLGSSWPFELPSCSIYSILANLTAISCPRWMICELIGSHPLGWYIQKAPLCLVRA
jgi:hypothetical protein